MDNRYSGYYHQEIDLTGRLYSCPVNPIHLIFKIMGTAEAMQAAYAIVVKAWIGNPEDLPVLNKVELRYFLGHIIDLEANNVIPQFYDEIKALPGIESVRYAVYDTAHRRMITNDEAFGDEIANTAETDLKIEVVGESDMFPEESALSLPFIND